MPVKYLDQNKESIKMGQDQKTDVPYAWFLKDFVKVLFLEGKLGARLCVQPV